MKRVCTVRSMVKFDIIHLREQAHYRARRGEWIRLCSIVPHKYHCLGATRQVKSLATLPSVVVSLDIL